MPQAFTHGLFGCFDNCLICIVTYFVPCYTAGKVAEKVGESCCLCALVMFVPILNYICSASIRQKVREQKGIQGGFLTDLVTVICCTPCALAQEAQEVNAFGSMAESMAIERE